MAKPTKTTSRAIIIRPVKLASKQRRILSIHTPPEFIKERKGKGNKIFKYVEGGYVIARLNEIFSPIGWDFKIVHERVETKEVVVRGKLTVKDYKTGYHVSKTQYGTKQRYAEIPLGDTLKAASTDCLKKCASLFGIALDVYWPELDRGEKIDRIVIGRKKADTVKKTLSRSELYDYTVKKIQREDNDSILYQMIGKIRSQRKELYTETAKNKLIQMIRKKLNSKNEG